MTRTIKLYGVPGTGKTTRLTRLAIRAAERYGPDRVCATTFTRAGADELKVRIAGAMNLRVPDDSWQRRKMLDQYMPWIGTTHSLAFKLIGRPPTMRASDITDFLHSQGSHATGPATADDMEGYTWAEPGRDEVEAALAVWSVARHRMLPVSEAHALMPWGYDGPTVSPERAERIGKAYEDYKRQVSRIDFEDMLEQGRRERPPVEVVLADEVQDNSPLLWYVLDTWADGLDYVMAGDPYQAIYLFSGAVPALFIDHDGEFMSLGDSHRLTAPAAERAQHVLRSGGYTEGDWLGTWTGIGKGEETDGSAFYLARTARLLGPVYDDLEGNGVPYGSTRGGGPLSTKAATAYRGLVRLKTRGAITLREAALIAEAADKGSMPYGETARLKALAKGDGDGLISLEQLRDRGWHPNPTGVLMGFRKGEYFDRVFGMHGLGAFINEPLVKVGTIHSAKGKEADTVHLVDSWATLPYRAATGDLAERQGEACVAYVGTTRHRVALRFVGSYEGTPYPGF